MLIELRVENHRSVGDEQALSFERSARPTATGGPGEVGPLRVVALYGANASGKSNVLAALCWMRDAVARSARFWAPDEGVPREPFSWGPMAKAPSTFEVRLRLEGIDYEYGFVVDDQRVLEEWLYAWPHGRKQTWFTRDLDEFNFGEHFTGEKRQIAELTRQNALYLSTAVQLRHKQIGPIYEWFRGVQTVNVEGARQHWFSIRASRLDPWVRSDEPQQSTPPEGSNVRHVRLLELLRTADIGVIDVKVEADPTTEEGDPWTSRRRGGQQRVLLQHQAHDEASWLPLEAESKGTQTLFRLGPVLLEALETGGLLVIDELESSFHPLLARHVVALFDDPKVNSGRAQLLFSTHDTHLIGTTIGPPTLSRDQVWFTEKDAGGATRLTALSEFTPRKAENLERGYLQGRYGAVPFLGTLNEPDGGER